MRVAFVLNSGAAREATATALRLMERLVARGHRVSVFAHDDAVTLSSGDSESARAVAALLLRGLGGGGVEWVVERPAAEALGIDRAQVPGVLQGDHGELWTIVRGADRVFSPGGR